MVFVNGADLPRPLRQPGSGKRSSTAIPYSLKVAITCGIGLFIAFIGLKNGGVDRRRSGRPSSPTAISPRRRSPSASRDRASPRSSSPSRIPGAIVLSIAAVTAVGLFVPTARAARVTCWPASIFSCRTARPRSCCKLSFGFLRSWAAFPSRRPDHPHPSAGRHVRQYRHPDRGHQARGLSRCGRAPAARGPGVWPGFYRHDPQRPHGNLDGVSYIESAAGVEAGGRTGLTTLTTAAFLLLALFLTPDPRRFPPRHGARPRRRGSVHDAIDRRDTDGGLSRGGARRAHDRRDPPQLQHRLRHRHRLDRRRLDRPGHRAGAGVSRCLAT